MNFWQSMNGVIEVELTSGDSAGALVAVSNMGICVKNTRITEDELTATFQIRRQELGALRKLCRRKGYDLNISGLGGIYWTVGRLKKRPVLLAGLVILLFLSAYLPTRVLFIRVEGNQNVPTRLILEKCADAGIRFGASRSLVRSEKVKNALLESIDELQWAGVNTSGCVATVTVRERSAGQTETEKGGVSCIVAKRDGIILSCTATSGTLKCRVGQAVRAGDLLISGYTDCGIMLQAGSAQGEILAQTRRNLEVVSPTGWLADDSCQLEEKKYALIIGKKRINFYKGSGILGTTCDKIYEENYITLPGGFVLPIAIVTEVRSVGQQSAITRSEEDMLALLEAFSAWYLPTQMSAGSVISKWETATAMDGIYSQIGYYACKEMIGQVRNEEIITPYGNDY